MDNLIAEIEYHERQFKEACMKSDGSSLDAIGNYNGVKRKLFLGIFRESNHSYSKRILATMLRKKK